jgi:hypothetical protein
MIPGQLTSPSNVWTGAGRSRNSTCGLATCQSGFIASTADQNPARPNQVLWPVDKTRLRLCWGLASKRSFRGANRRPRSYRGGAGFLGPKLGRPPQTPRFARGDTRWATFEAKYFIEASILLLALPQGFFRLLAGRDLPVEFVSRRGDLSQVTGHLIEGPGQSPDFILCSGADRMV